MTVQQSDIEWARQAMRDGRSLSYIASVLELSEKKARSAIFSTDKVARPVSYRRPTPEASPHPFRSPDPYVQLEVIPNQRRSLLRRRYALCWDMIWFLRAKHMSGRTLRNIYGAEALIWSVGGGIDVEI